MTGGQDSLGFPGPRAIVEAVGSSAPDETGGQDSLGSPGRGAIAEEEETTGSYAPEERGGQYPWVLSLF